MGNTSLPYEIVHCSSWDEEYNPEQLVKSSPGNNQLADQVQQQKCKGWQTPKFPEYPQDLIIHLLSGGAARIEKVQILSHHFKIATKIDVYIGILKDAQDVLEDILPDTLPSDEEDNMLIEFTRLGYVCFDNNARAQFRARELKSIKINADGEYVRLVIRNCHRNRLNTYNQVGILALNILGQPLVSPCSTTSQNQRHLFDDNSILSSSTRRTSISSNQSNSMNRLSTNNGLELELQQWTSALLEAEEEAVRNESYQIAKTYKFLGDKLERFTKILSDLEIGKRHAVETKDYDEAEKIKDDIKEIKQAAELLLKQAHIQIIEGHVVPLEQQQELIIPTSFHQLEETTIIGGTTTMIPSSFDEEEELHQDTTTTIPMIEEEEEEEEYIDPESIPEPIMDEERGPYTLAIQVFGEDIVACVLSIKSKCRGRGLGLIEQRIESVQALARNNQYQELSIMIYDTLAVMNDEYDEYDEDMDEMTRSTSHFINATFMMIQEAVMDSREPIVTLAMSTWHQLNDFIIDIDIPTRYIIEWMERTFSGLLKRTGDSNIKIKHAATILILVLVQSFHILMPLYICKPERMIHNYKEAKSRIELVEATVMKLSVEPKAIVNTTSKVPLKDLMAFVVAYLNHAHDEVRQAAVKLVVTISDQIGFNLVSSYIDEKLRLSLAETVQKLVDKDSYYQQQQQQKKKTVATKKSNTTKETMSELRALAVQPEKKTTLSSNKSIKRTATDTKRTTPASATATKSKPSTKATTTRATTTTRKPTTAATKEKAAPAPPAPINENSICIFCDEVNSAFNEDTLIKHYYNTCPVLTNCPMCQIITEISTLNEHMLVDCERRHLIKECTRCKQAIPVEQWLQHTLKQTCHLKKDENDIRCPLCFISIDPPNEAGWSLHLMTGEGCTKLKKSRAPTTKKNKK